MKNLLLSGGVLFSMIVGGVCQANYQSDYYYPQGQGYQENSSYYDAPRGQVYYDEQPSYQGQPRQIYRSEYEYQNNPQPRLEIRTSESPSYQQGRNYSYPSTTYSEQSTDMQGTSYQNRENYPQQQNSWFGDSEKRSDRPQPSDAEITKNIKDNLKKGIFSKGYETISVEVRNGDVNLRGNVDADNDRQDVLKRVRAIAGVRRVNDQIRIVAAGRADTDMRYSQPQYKNGQQYNRNLPQQRLPSQGTRSTQY